MESPWNLLRRALGAQREGRLLQLFTPVEASNRSWLTRLALASGSVLAIGVAGTVAAGAFVTLLLALGGIYFLVTQVLGVELDIDPQTLVQRARVYAGGR